MTSPLKKYLAAALLLLPFAAPAAQPESHPAAQVGAQEFILRDSAGLKREYRIQVAAVGKAPASGYPVLYVLDGDALFPMVTGAAQNMVMRAEENNAVSASAIPTANFLISPPVPKTTRRPRPITRKAATA